MVDVYDDFVTRVGLTNAILMGDLNAGPTYVSQSSWYSALYIHVDVCTETWAIKGRWTQMSLMNLLDSPNARVRVSLLMCAYN